ncbi:unnamed protein product [Prunus armeniaca]
MKLKSSTCIKNFSKTIFESNLASQERAVGVGYVAFKQPSKETLQWDNIVRLGFDSSSSAASNPGKTPPDQAQGQVLPRLQPEGGDVITR